MATSSLEQAFRERFESLRARHPELACEWRAVPSLVWGDRVDLVCTSASGREVWATVRDASIAVGGPEGHTDVEDFGRGRSDLQLAEEALELLARMLRDQGLISPGV